MYLCKDLYDLNGHRYPMSGCFPFETKMFSRLKALGYREITMAADTVVGKAGQIIRGHEFHYSELSRPASTATTVYRVADRCGMKQAPGGHLVNQTLGSYTHLHFGSNPQAAVRFVETCLNYRRKRMSGSTV